MSTAPALLVPGLLDGLVDDAAVFPPGLAPMADAVPRHLQHTGAPYAGLVGPFLVPAGAVEPFAAAVRALPPAATLRAGIVADPGAADPLGEALAALESLGSLAVVRPVALEVPLPRGGSQSAAAARLPGRLAGLPDGVRAWVEVQREPGWRDALASVAAAGAGIGGKLRTGGTTAQAFPSPAELAAFLHHAAGLGARFKLTAGLHTAVRGPDPTGADHHGLLNVLLALHAALGGADVAEVEQVLTRTDVASLTAAARELTDDDAAAIRAHLASFGCCGVTDPIDDLAALGLLQEAAR